MGVKEQKRLFFQMASLCETYASVYVHVCIVHTGGSQTCMSIVFLGHSPLLKNVAGEQKCPEFESLELEFWVFMSCLTLMLRIKLRSSHAFLTTEPPLEPLYLIFLR